MIYTQLSKNYKYQVIAESIYGRELEHFHYDFDKKNFERILETATEGDYKTDVEKRLSDTLMQMAKVEAIYAALMSQVDDQEAYDAAVIRTTEKREADKLKEKK